MKTSIDILAMANPAFGAILLRSVAKGYKEFADAPIPLPVAFLAVPLVFTPTDLGEVFTGSNKRTGFLPWISRHPEILPGFAKRTKALAPYVIESLTFGTQHHFLAVEQEGVSPDTEGLIKEPDWSSRDERGKLLRNADRLGFWLAGVSSIATLYSTLGVRP